MSENPVYRVPGFLSTRSLNYLEGLRKNGWPEDQIDHLKTDLVRFESASVMDDIEEAKLCFIFDHHPTHESYFQKLNAHIKALTRAQRYEELQRKAQTNSKDSIAANLLLARAEGRDVDLSALKMKHVKPEKLQAMSDDDLKREISAAASRLGAPPGG